MPMRAGGLPWSAALVKPSLVALGSCFIACARPAPVNPRAGQVRMALAAQAQDPAGSARPVCATFSLTPYALGAGGAQTLAGTAVSFTTGAQGGAPILGCMHTPGIAPDWRYLVTASGFIDCSTQQPIAGLTPSIETFAVDVACTPGQDVPASVTAQVSIPAANDAGYLDIGVGINVDTPPSGCKMADIDSKGFLHFGQSYVQSQGGASPSAYTGIGLFIPPATSGSAATAGSVQQFAGSVTAAGAADAFFTGLLLLPPAPQEVTLVQAFAKGCPGQLTIQPNAVECVTRASAAAGTTEVKVAGVFASWPGRGSVSASIDGASTFSLETSLGGPHLGTVLPAVTGHDDLTRLQQLSVAPQLAIGIYGSLVHSDELLALVQDPAAGAEVIVLTLDEGSGLWSAGTPAPLSSFTLLQQQQLGLFGPGGCFPEPLPACVAGPSALACTPMPAAYAELPGTSGVLCPSTLEEPSCSGSTWNPQFYWQFEPGKEGLDSTGNGHSYGPPYATAPDHGSPVNGYIKFDETTYPAHGVYQLPAGYDCCGFSAAPAGQGLTLEMKLRFLPSTFREWAGSGGSPLYKDGDLANNKYGISISYDRTAFAATVGTTSGRSYTVYFPMRDGQGPGSWAFITDDHDWHHFALVVNTTSATPSVRLYIDGYLPRGFEQPLHLAPGDTTIPPATYWTLGYSQPWLKMDIDEIARYSNPIPPTLVTQHARQVAHQPSNAHYTFQDSCPQVLCAPQPALPVWPTPNDSGPGQSYDYAADARDFATTSQGTPYFKGGATTTLPADQLAQAPLPRFVPGHTLGENVSWFDNFYAAIEGNGVWDGSLTTRQRAQRMYDLGLEMSRHWNYMVPLEQFATSGAPHGDGTPGSVGWADVPAALPGHKTSVHTFWQLGQGKQLTSADRLAAAPDLIDPLVALNQPWKTEADGQDWAATLQQVANQIAGRIDFIDEDNELGAYPDYAGAVHYTRAKLTPAGQSYYDAQYGALSCGNAAASPIWTCGAAAQFGADITNLLRQQFITGLKSQPGTAGATVGFYNIDGFSTQAMYGSYDDFHPALWSYGAGNVEQAEPPLSWQPAGSVQHLAGPNVYIDDPVDLWKGGGGNHALSWLDNAVYFQAGRGDQLFMPYVSAASLGGWGDGREDLRPDSLLALEKALAFMGAVRFRPAAFNGQGTGSRCPGNAANCATPFQAEDYIYEMMTAPYAQAVLGNFEGLYRSSRLAFSVAMGIPPPRRLSSNPKHINVSREVLDPVTALPDGRYLFMTSIQALRNDLAGKAGRTGTSTFTLADGGPEVTVPTSSAGLSYQLDLRNPAKPVLYNYDGWHELTHPQLWWHGFQLEAEVNQGEANSASGASLEARTEAANLASLDFSTYTTMLGVKAATKELWPHDLAAQAPHALYSFEPRDSWATTDYVWVRARIAPGGSGSSSVHVQLDGGPAITLGCVAGNAWQWVNTDLATGQPARFDGVTPVAHTLTVGLGSSDLEIDQVKLAPEAGHQECPVSSSCGCR
jgi:hypothetical protein